MSNVVCTACGFIGDPARVTKGSIWVELILWLCFIVPGIIYSIWRLSSRHDGCPKCGQTSLIPVDSPMGMKFIRENLPEQVASVVNSERGSATAAEGVGKALGRAVGRLFR